MCAKFLKDFFRKVLERLALRWGVPLLCSQSIRNKRLIGKVFGNKDLLVRLGVRVMQGVLCRTEKPVCHARFVRLISGRFDCGVMCTVHIFRVHEFWVKVVCHKLGFILRSLLWKKIQKRRHLGYPEMR